MSNEKQEKIKEELHRIMTEFKNECKLFGFSAFTLATHEDLDGIASQAVNVLHLATVDTQLASVLPCVLEYETLKPEEMMVLSKISRGVMNRAMAKESGDGS